MKDFLSSGKYKTIILNNNKLDTLVFTFEIFIIVILNLSILRKS